jgi:hypothetical protein
MEAMLAFGPGDLLGRPYRLDDEDRALIERSYQVHPPQHSGPCRFVDGKCERGGICGRRRFDTVAIVTRKGTLKSERLAATAAAELAENAPVRCDGFRKAGKGWEPVGRPVTSPFVFLFAFAKEQAEDTSWDAMRNMILLGPGRDLFDVWEERIMRRAGTGEAKPLATAPDSRDGGKTTFQGKEEGHRWVLPRQLEAHSTTVGNLSKRPIAQPWELHASTMYSPGEGSVVEKLHEGARKLAGDEAHKTRLFFYYRWADTRIKIRNESGDLDRAALREAVLDATGPVKASWSDITGIVERQFLAADSDPDYAERVWLNRPKQRTEVAFDSEAWKANVKPGYRIAKGATVVLSFDGSRGTTDPHRSPDHAGLVATEITTGFQQKLGHWDPATYEDRRIPRNDVSIAVDDAFTTYNVWRMYADPPDWDPEIAEWQSKYGADKVIEWFTWRERPIGYACANYAKAITAGEVTHDGDPVFAAHIGHAHKRPVNARDNDGNRLWTIQKERDGSQLKIDLAMCGVLGWEARNDAVAAGALTTAPSESAYAGMSKDQILARMLGLPDPEAEDEDEEQDEEQEPAEAGAPPRMRAWT